jgi:hypothetical protein
MLCAPRHNNAKEHCMRVGFPVIFIRNGVEHAGVTVTSSPKQEQIPHDPNQPLTSEQRFGELRCSIAFWDCEIRGWRQADNVPYLSIELEVPAEGDFYSEVGAPDPAERKAAAAEYAAQLAKATPEPIAAAEARSPDPVGFYAKSDGALDVELPSTSAELAVEESINEALLETSVDEQGESHG